VTGIVVVGVDGSDGARRALRWAAKEARLRSCTLRVVHAWSYLDQPDDVFDPGYGEGDARRLVDDEVAGIGADGEGIDVDPVTVCDLPAHGLLEAAAGADLLVVGARGLGGFEGVLLGSVGQQVAHHSPCPVVIVPETRRVPAG
jgi:nucleotide-binding universal stress UspA family protein